MAVLAGDALLTAAFTHISNADLSDTQKIRAVKVLSECAGEIGMVGGQVLDMQSEERQCTPQEVIDIQVRKTGALIKAACQMGVIAANGTSEQLEAAETFAYHTGLAFQIRDDMLDVIGDAQELGKATGVDTVKNTFVQLYGIEKCDLLVREHTEKAESALNTFENSEYSKAIEAFTKLGDYKNSAELLQKAVFERKYSSYNINVDIDPLYFEEAGIKTAEEVEAEMSALLYGEWYAEETGEKISVNSEQINARAYGINYATHTGGTIVVNFYYLDEPEKTYNIANTGLWFDYIDMRVSALRITLNDPNIYEESLFYSITAEEYNTLVEQDAQAAAKQQRYSNEAVIQKAFSVFKNRIGGNYSGAGKLYHSSSYSDANVVYYWESKTYVCTFIGKYSTNIFDVFGTSTKTYVVSAEYRDTGSDLMMLSFDIS